MARATAEEIERVRETECADTNHIFDVVQTMGHDGPREVICQRCSKSWVCGEEPDEIILNQVIGYLKGKASLARDEEPNAPTQAARSELNKRATTYELAAEKLAEEGGPSEEELRADEVSGSLHGAAGESMVPPMGAAPLCVCGHRADHHGHQSTVGGTACKAGMCKCGEYRPGGE